MKPRIEAVRLGYRPERIMTLFVGESPPDNGDFFYCDQPMMQRHYRTAVEAAFGKSDDFLNQFKSLGWYLDHLVSEPVDHLNPAERERKRARAVGALAARIAVYKPEAIVCATKSVEKHIRAAAAMAGCRAPIYAVPFAGQRHQSRFLEAMAAIITKLPTRA